MAFLWEELAHGWIFPTHEIRALLLTDDRHRKCSVGEKNREALAGKFQKAYVRGVGRRDQG